MGRRDYEGEWREGAKTGKGRMTFVSGDFYEGDFVDGVPHGEGRFHYPESGQVETAAFEEGRRHGTSRCRTPGGTEEEIPYVDGVALGTATLRMADGGVEERTYENGKSMLITYSTYSGIRTGHSFVSLLRSSNADCNFRRQTRSRSGYAFERILRQVQLQG